MYKFSCLRSSGHQLPTLQEIIQEMVGDSLSLQERNTIEVAATSHLDPDRVTVSESCSSSIDTRAIQRNETPLDVRDLRLNPYTNNLDSMMAILSIKNRCYGKRLDEVYKLFTGMGIRLVGCCTSARELGIKEDNCLHPGLKFAVQHIDMPSCPMTPAMKLVLYPLQIIMRNDMKVVLIELLTRTCVAKKLHYTFEPKYDKSGTRIYQGFHTAAVWETMQKRIGIGEDIAGFLIFTDSTRILNFGSRHLHPIYMCPAGLHYSHLNLECMTLLGFLPSLPAHMRDVLTEVQKTQLANWTKIMISSIYAHIIKSVHRFTDCGISFIENYGTRTVHPFVITAISDHPEGNNIANLDMLSCRYCVTDKDDYCTTDVVGEARCMTASNSNPLSAPNIFPFDPFLTAHCIFHDVDEGIWRWMLVEIVIPMFSSTSDQMLLCLEIDHRTVIPGLQHISSLTAASVQHLTARQMRQLMAQTVVSLASWTFRDSLRDSVFMAVLTLCQWYMIVRSQETSENEIAIIEKLSLDLRIAIRTAFRDSGKEYETKAIKHHVILHYPLLIRRYGAMLYQSCEMWDSAHKYMIKSHLQTHDKANFQKSVQHRVCHHHVMRVHFC